MNHIFKLAFIFIINIIFLINASATTMDKDKFVEVNGIKIHYVEEGEGPPLLLIHGGGLTAKSWQGLAKEASRYFRVIMPDSRGHGLTNNPQGTFSYDLMTEDMAAFVKALKLEKTAGDGLQRWRHGRSEVNQPIPGSSARCYRRRRNASLCYDPLHAGDGNFLW
ncbi:hydrolase [Salmonella enterica subsp. enterica serovar Heidelberg]|nr:hydrolase [Salmonella enterica subsp. enterica serovar Heidelberg]